MDRDPRQLQSEINQLIKKQLDTLGREIFGGVTDAEHQEYEQRQRRIDELYGELQRLKSAAWCCGTSPALKKGSLACDCPLSVWPFRPRPPEISPSRDMTQAFGGRSARGHTILQFVMYTRHDITLPLVAASIAIRLGPCGTHSRPMSVERQLGQ